MTFIRHATLGLIATLFLAASYVAALGANAGTAAPAAAATGFSALLHFQGGSLADWPRGGLAIGPDGTLYGTTLYDGPCSTKPYCGVIFSLAKPAAGKTAWSYKIIRGFGSSLEDGISPVGPLTFSNNVIYGTTSAGADPNCGCGEVFSFTKSGTGWTYKILHRFTKIGGSTPNTGVLRGSDGTLYGTTTAGGSGGYGVIYKLSPGGTFTILHTFVQATGATPQGELIVGKDGAMYGTAFGGGRYNQGVVYRITSGGSYSVLYHFLGVNQPGNSHDGAQPEGRLALGPDGTLYGTTAFGGTPSGYGTAWSLTPPGTGQTVWRYKQLFIFGKSVTEPNLPHAGLVRDSAGNLYGASAGGDTYGGGTLYRLNPPKPGGVVWTVTVLRNFIPRNPNGSTAYADLLLSGGVIYGTTLTGGILNDNCRDGCGIVFSYTP